MLSITLKFKPSSHSQKQGRLYYQVLFNRSTRQVSTPHRIYASEWSAATHDLVVHPHLGCSKHLQVIRQTIQDDFSRFTRIERELSCSVFQPSIDALIAEYHKQSQGLTFFGYMQQVIHRYILRGQHRTSETYVATLNSFKRFRLGADLFLQDVRSELFEGYEAYLKQRGLSLNTISFYLKHLRAVYNRAVDDELVVDRKPFKRVTITTEKTAKRALPLSVIKRIKEMDLSQSPSCAFARDMFLFSFYTRGMSFVDIAYLQKKNLKGGFLFYRRKKTNQQLVIRWEPCMQKILQSYMADSSSPYLFSILPPHDSDPRRQYKNALFCINRHLKEIGRQLGLSHSLTMYCARHSWASIARDEGISISIISEGMGHDSVKTTQIYLASLKTEVIDKANRKILRLL